ncbi:protein kinase domain-containing protein [Lactococcus lactis]|uniref:protein kinase domain-containing protein n=1 Tax=Lactococcus lactis TaxID=1358 RepID=UPI0022E5C38B|nr:protein kinase [Lactococcus lactis]
MEQDNKWYLLGQGGFAEVYGSNNRAYAIKHLLQDSKSKKNFKRFKREYEITKSLSDVDNIIPVYKFNSEKQYYTMLRCDDTLRKYLDGDTISEENKNKIIDTILITMEQVHDRKILHRDLSCDNILIKNIEKEISVYISDFGIGKSLDSETSYQTKNTNGLGRYEFTAPEQLKDLKSASKASDVFSLGKIINYVYTGSTLDNGHIYGAICDKACSKNPKFRQSDAGDLRREIEQQKNLSRDVKLKKLVLEQMAQGKYDENSQNYIQSLKPLELTKYIRDDENFIELILWYIQNNHKIKPDNTLNIIKQIDKNCAEVYRTYTDADNFASLAFGILSNPEQKYSYEINRYAAEILKWSAYDIGRFDAQIFIERLLDVGIEPTIEQIFKNEFI